MTDFKYEKEINSFLSTAETIANQMVRQYNYETVSEYRYAWDSVFHDEMHRLTAEAGLRFIGRYRKRDMQ